MLDEAWLNTVRIARDCGDISSLFPEGITRLVDLPFTLHSAIRMALYFLKFDELPDQKDRPPKHLWLDEDKMEQWWKEVEENQKSRSRGEPDMRDMPQNDYARAMLPEGVVG